MSQREWLVIESTRWYGVFRPEGLERVQGFIPRDVAEKLLGRRISEGTEWFSKEESAMFRAHPEWRTEI